MKKNLVTIILAMACIAVNASAARAAALRDIHASERELFGRYTDASEFTEKWTWDIGSEIYYVKYEEPDFMEDKGAMYGLTGSVTMRDALMLKLEGRFALGEVDYTSVSTGSMDDVDDYTFETRGLVGYDFPFEGFLFTPYLGIAYRYLNDDSGGRTTSTGHRGYERESNYFYSPAGFELLKPLNDDWSATLCFEYDIFWHGVQESHLSDAIGGLGDVENDQEGGYGLRGSLKLRKRGRKYDLIIEPFIRWWKIDDSEISSVTFSGVVVGYGLEPENKTMEVGVNIAVAY